MYSLSFRLWRMFYHYNFTYTNKKFSVTVVTGVVKVSIVTDTVGFLAPPPLILVMGG